MLIASTYVPFVKGGGTKIVMDLERELRARGHVVDSVLLPFAMDPEKIPAQMLALRLIDLSASGDVMIAIRTPSYILSHPNKVVWFIHHHRGAYDLWGTNFQDLPNTRAGVETRRIITEADAIHLREVAHLFTNSERVADRLRAFNGLESEVLYPPLGDVSAFSCEGYGNFVFCPGRLSNIKRQRLLIEAMAHVRSDVRLVVAGSPDHEHELLRLQKLVEQHGVGSRVELKGTWISEDEKVELLANALACAYVAYDEDSYGYVTLESYESRKPVITCTDSGGTLELVEDDVTGKVVDPDPRAIAEAMDELRTDPAAARRMGKAGYERMRSLDISWDRVIERLLA